MQFGFHGGVDIVMECKVVPESVYTYRECNFVKRGRLQDMPDIAFASHYIRKDKRWYVLTLFYPFDYCKAVGRILYKIQHWQAAQANGEPLQHILRSKSKQKHGATHENQRAR